MNRPLIVELLPPPDPTSAFLRLADKPHCLFLDSSRHDPQLGRYSFLTADPFEFLEYDTSLSDVKHLKERGAAACTDRLGLLSARLTDLQSSPIDGLPPFQGGAAGLASYDLGRWLERLPPPALDEFRTPALAVGLYDVVIAFDHLQQRAWIVSQGWPEVDAVARCRRAQARIQQVQTWLAAPVARQSVIRPYAKLIPAHQLAPQFPAGDLPHLTSNFSPDAYRAAVARVIEYIHAGDVFQVNLAQRLLYPADCESIDLYLRLRERNAATFGGYFDLGEFRIVSSSPERFLQVRDGHVETRPIKGTRRRRALPEADLFAGDDLQASDKDRAENVMIVDLLRNDLARVCQPESVRVTQLCRLESYEFVQHLVSAVEGDLRQGLGPLDLLKAAFPGGSITGAPKVRAMEIIAELEPTARGPYCGSLFYLGFDGAFDSNILIRTITCGRGWWQFPVGGGIVAQSDPQREYEETWHKAEGLLRALR
jgi:para-aminobenzoate synthetase component 1